MITYRSCDIIRMSSGFTVGVAKILCYGFQMCTVIRSFGYSGESYSQHRSKRRNSPVTLHDIRTRKVVSVTVNTVIPRLTSDPTNEFFAVFWTRLTDMDSAKWMPALT